MATVTKLSATTHRLKYKIALTGADTFTIANATLLTDCKKGPLYDLFNKTYADTATVRAALENSDNVDMYFLPQAVAGEVPAASLFSAGSDVDGSQKPVIGGNSGNTTNVILCIQYRYSTSQ